MRKKSHNNESSFAERLSWQGLALMVLGLGGVIAFSAQALLTDPAIETVDDAYTQMHDAAESIGAIEVDGSTDATTYYREQGNFLEGQTALTTLDTTNLQGMYFSVNLLGIFISAVVLIMGTRVSNRK